MTISHLIAEFTRVNEELDSALMAGDIDLISKLDKSVSSLMDNILAFTPETAEDRQAAMHFLLDHLFQHIDRTPLNESIRNKLLKL